MVIMWLRNLCIAILATVASFIMSNVTFAGTESVADSVERIWRISVSPVDEELEKFQFEAILTKLDVKPFDDDLLSSSEGMSEFRIPRIVIERGKDAEWRIPGPDGKPAIEAKIFISEELDYIRYQVMANVGDEIYRAATEIALSTVLREP